MESAEASYWSGSGYAFKTIHGPTLYSRKPQTQQTEIDIKIKLLNIMTAQGMPVSKKVKKKKRAS